MPDSLPAVVSDTARSVTRGARNAYQKAVKLQDYFAVNGGFRYDTEVRSGTGTTAIARFLRDKEGFCVHFSFSMAAMARTLGIRRGWPWASPGHHAVERHGLGRHQDAHAWPELYFEGVGWTRFEPTPSRGSQPDYTLDPTPSDDAPRRCRRRPTPRASRPPSPRPPRAARPT
ncbi:transglutaminase-like domain-containing protein [Streptomyces sp. M19]